MCPGYSASLNGAVTAGFTLPTDPVSSNSGKILVSTHAYTPYDLCLGDDTDTTSAKYTQFTDAGKKELDSLFESLNTKFLSKGIGVVMGEMGISNKDNNDARTAWASYYYGLSKKYTLPCVLWDNNAQNGSTKSENHWHLNRKTNKWGDPDVIQAIMDAMGVKNVSIPVDGTVVTKKSQTVTGTKSYTKTFNGSAFTLDAKNTTSGGSALTYSSSDTSVVTVSSAGKVTIKGAGTAVVTVTAVENASFKSASLEVKITVNPQDLSSKGSVDAIADQEYTGKEITPAVKVKNSSKTVLVKGRDYTVTYSNNVNPGTATAKITFIGNYTGSISTTFKITGTAAPEAPVISSKVSSTANAAKISWNSVSGADGYRVYRYDATAKKWKSIAVVKTTSYRDSGLSSATVYKYKVKAYTKTDGKTIYSEASATKSVVTKPATPKITKSTKTSTSVKLYWNKVKCAGIKVQRYDASTKTWKTVKTVSGSATSYTVTGLKKNTSYKFRLQAYTSKTPYRTYSAYSSTYSVKTNK
jgi:hypothetical protein